MFGINEVYAKLIAAGTLLAALCAGAWFVHHRGYESGKQEVQTNWDKAKADKAMADNAAILAQVKNNERIAAQQEADNQKLKDAHAKEIAQITAAAASPYRLRLPATVCSEFASSTKAEGSTGGNPTPAGAVALPEQIERNLRELMAEADTVTAGCRVAQDFIQRNGMN